MELWNKKKNLHSLIGETTVGKVDPVMKNDLNKIKLQHVSERGLYQLQRQGLCCREMIKNLSFVSIVCLENQGELSFTCFGALKWISSSYEQTNFRKSQLSVVECRFAKYFQGESSDDLVNLINRCPISAIGFKTPQELRTGTKVDCSNRKMLCCIPYAHIR